MSLLFEWDEDKNIENQKKHGISFEDAVLVFSSHTRFEYDDKHSTFQEDRYIATGYIKKHGLVMVVHCEIVSDAEDVIRIISARKGIYEV
jgi:uncharacterized DUF497 family protein